MSELITLVGGPASGARYHWSGGDVLQLAPIPRAGIITAKGEPPPRLHDDRITYRRSLVTRSQFVWQP